MADNDQVTRAMAAQEHHLESLSEIRNVVGVGTSCRTREGKLTDEICVQVLVNRKLPMERLMSRDVIPPVLEVPEGYEVSTDVLEVAPIVAQPDTTRYRPVPAGCSIGPQASVSAGTLGGWACDNTDDTIVLLTNNHVISNLDTMPVLDQIVQPGRLDGGLLPGDVIGRLKRDITVNTVANVPGASPPNSVVDAAIGTIEEEYTSDLLDLNIPVIFEIQAPAIGMDVQKRGRTTLLTTNGQITGINFTLLIGYRNSTRLGRIQNCFIITSTDGNPFSAAGDSGSLILNQEDGEMNGTLPVVGLLFAGGENGFGVPITIANDINAVFAALNLTTVCACVARAITEAVYGAELLRARDMPRFLMHKERQLRRFRYQVTRPDLFGEAIEGQIRAETARVGKILVEDDEAFGLLVRALRPLVKQPTNYDILQTELDRETLDNLKAFGNRLSKVSRALRPKVGVAKRVLDQLEGMTVEQILSSAKLSLKD